MITPYLSQQPVDDFSLRFASLKYSATLAVSTDTTLTVPADTRFYMALIKCEPSGSPVWVSVNAVAAAPAGASFASTTSELLDTIRICREVKSGDVLHFFTAATGVNISVVLYAYLTNN